MTLTTAEKSARYRAKNVEAYRERKNALARTEKHKQQRRVYMRGWRAKNREKHNAWARRYHAANRPKYQEANRRRYYLQKYGLTPEAAVELRQKGCEICGAKGRLHIDHDHNRPGTYRGVLCMRCNTSLGWFEKRREAVIKYADMVW